ncbi:hypothetical protein GEMRC1_012566 [Eukaryota sp. GEM-RC1]
MINPLKYPVYVLSVAYNLLALALDSSSLVSAVQLTVTKEMLFEIRQKLNHLWTTSAKCCSVCSDLPNASFFSVSDTNTEAEVAIQTLLKSISPTNPRVTVFARSVVKVIDQIVLASDTVILNFEVRIDHVFPPLLLDLFSNDVISKDFVGLSCTPQDVADFFFLQNFTNVVDRSSLVPRSVLDLIEATPHNTSKNLPKLSLLFVSEFQQFIVISYVLELFASLTFTLQYFFKSNGINLPSQSFVKNLNEPSSCIQNLACQESNLKANRNITVFPSDSVCNLNDVIYQSDVLGLAVVPITKSRKKKSSVLVC